MKSTDKELALFGGNPSIKEDFKRYNPYGSEELEAAKKVIASGVLSDFYGTNSDKFNGGENVRAFEAELAKFYGVKFVQFINNLSNKL